MKTPISLIFSNDFDFQIVSVLPGSDNAQATKMANEMYTTGVFDQNKIGQYVVISFDNTEDMNTWILAQVNKCPSRSTKEQGHEVIDVTEFYGEVIDIEENTIEILCLLDHLKEEKVTQLRHFDKIPFQHLGLQVNDYVLIKTTTKLGSRLFEFTQVKQDLSKLFEKKDYFKELEDTAFLKFNHE